MGRGSYSEQSPLYLPAVHRLTPFHIKLCPVAPDVLECSSLGRVCLVFIYSKTVKSKTLREVDGCETKC